MGLGKPAAKKGDDVVGIDTHVLVVATLAGPVPTPTPLVFNGPINDGTSADVLACNEPLAIDGSTADNQPAHIPLGGAFSKPPSNKATVRATCATVLVNNKPVARDADTAMTCNDPADAPNGNVIGGGTVLIGD